MEEVFPAEPSAAAQPPYISLMADMPDSAAALASWQSVSAFRDAHLVPAAIEGEAGAAAAPAVEAQARTPVPAARRPNSNRAKKRRALSEAISAAAGSGR